MQDALQYDPVHGGARARCLWDANSLHLVQDKREESIMGNGVGKYRYRAALSCACALLYACATVMAAEPGKLPNVMILATGGTIAGKGASRNVN